MLPGTIHSANPLSPSAISPEPHSRSFSRCASHKDPNPPALEPVAHSGTDPDSRSPPKPSKPHPDQIPGCSTNTHTPEAKSRFPGSSLQSPPGPFESASVPPPSPSPQT